MKKKIVCTLMALAIGCGALGAFTACSTPDNPDKGSKVDKIQASLLDGKIANFMGAEAFGLVDKNQQPSASGNSGFSAVGFDAGEEQAKFEFTKETEGDFKDVHFYNADEKVKSYKDLNKKYEKHHHKSVECAKPDCDEISDEIEQEENTAESGTVVSLDARVNKLYNHGDFTFMSVSSAVEGKVRVLTAFNRFQGAQLYQALENDTKLPTVIYVQAPYSGWSFIEIPGGNGKKPGIILVKRSEEETDYHTTNYWSDNYNQSYIIDNNTGKAYSLSQFPYIYSVQGGLIKVYNNQANGYFDYYIPKITESGLSFDKIQLPSKEEFPMPASDSAIKVDKWGNIVVEANGMASSDASFNTDGEKIYNENIILSVPKQNVVTEIANKISNQQYAGLFSSRYLKAKNYHLGSDGRIYRLNFKGNLSEVSLNVLNQNRVWQAVEKDITVDFTFMEKFVGYQFGLMGANRDEFLLTKISNGYAYYSNAAHVDGSGYMFEGMILKVSGETFDYGEYSGVVKIPVDGPVKVETDYKYEHLKFAYEAFIGTQKDVGLLKYDDGFSTMLLGETKMLFGFAKNGSSSLCVLDVETGESKIIKSSARLLAFKKDCILVEPLGWLSLSEDVDYEDFDQSYFTEEMQSKTGKLEAYFKFITEKTK